MANNTYKMIPRVRPEARYHEIFGALWTKDANAAISTFADFLKTTLSLNFTPIFTPSGRAALYYLFLASPFKRVYIPAYTCWVVAEAAHLAGKEIQLLDVAYPALHIKHTELKRIRAKPGIVVATHQFGYPEDVDVIQEILKGFSHVIVEDCAGAMFSRYQGNPVGLKGDAAIFSFETGKSWPLGGGGAIVIKDAELRSRVREIIEERCTIRQNRGNLFWLAARRILTQPSVYSLLLRIYLSVRPPTEGMPRFNNKPTKDYTRAFTPCQAKLGLIMGRHITEIADKRKKLFHFYNRAVEGIPGIGRVQSLPQSQVCPMRFPILIKQGNKLDIYSRMVAAGVDLGFTFSYCLGDGKEFPGAQRIARECLNLPVYSEVTLDQAQKIVDLLATCATAKVKC